MNETAFPLSWPTGWPRTKTYARNAARFGSRANGATMTSALDFLKEELGRLRAANPVISTSVRGRPDGRPYANQAKPEDPGAAVYFTLNKRRLVLACDKWSRVEDNLQAIAKHIEAMRGQARWGVGSVEQAFAGYTALESPKGPDCWEVLGVTFAATEAQVLAAWRERVKTAHPDAGGSHEAFTALSQAKDIALATIASRKGGA